MPAGGRLTVPVGAGAGGGCRGGGLGGWGGGGGGGVLVAFLGCGGCGGLLGGGWGGQDGVVGPCRLRRLVRCGQPIWRPSGRQAGSTRTPWVSSVLVTTPISAR